MVLLGMFFHYFLGWVKSTPRPFYFVVPVSPTVKLGMRVLGGAGFLMLGARFALGGDLSLSIYIYIYIKFIYYINCININTIYIVYKY